MQLLNTLNPAQVPGFGRLLVAYLNGNNNALPAYAPLDKAQITRQIELKKSFGNREVLVKALNRQYNGLPAYAEVTANIERLKHNHTFCITTGHQLALVGGPLFVAYKILTTIKLCQDYKNLLPGYDFVPVFWLASEDHDKAEIDHFAVRENTYAWETSQGGAVGEFNTEGITALLETLFAQNPGINQQVQEIFNQAYTQPNLAVATRHAIHALFGHYGLVIVDGNDAALKQLFVPVIEEEINNKVVQTAVSITNEKLAKAGFEAAINPRELNLFLLTNGDRKRLEFTTAGLVQAVGGTESWGTSEFLDFARSNPQSISPNVLLRPVYQETILPNLAYIGGPAETEYWLQLDELFARLNLPIPLRILRLSVTLVKAKQAEKITEAGIPLATLFDTEDKIAKWWTTTQGGQNLDFTHETEELKSLFDRIAVKAKQTDATLEAAVMAEKTRQEKALANIAGRIVKAEKNKHEVEINRLHKIRAGMLPHNKPQERLHTLAELETGDLNAFFAEILSQAQYSKMNVFAV